MVRKDHRENVVGPWARQKLDALEEYLRRYMSILGKRHFRLIYIDAFAGGGISRIREHWEGVDEAEYYGFFDDGDDGTEDPRESFIRGSPLRALDLDPGFAEHFFFDLDPTRADVLEQLSRQYANKKITVVTGDANENIVNLVGRFDRRSTRGFAFLDPYGPHLEWRTLEALAKTRCFEIVINFPLGMAINRLIKRDGEMRPTWIEALDKCFGDNAWHDVSYRTQYGLFEDEYVEKANDAGAQLLELYTHRLSKIFDYVSHPSVVRNTRGSPLYYILFAGPNKNGARIANHILMLGERVKVHR